MRKYKTKRWPPPQGAYITVFFPITALLATSVSSGCQFPTTLQHQESRSSDSEVGHGLTVNGSVTISLITPEQLELASPGTYNQGGQAVLSSGQAKLQASNMTTKGSFELPFSCLMDKEK
ncbi:unnamed protein product [Lepidochelys olivacea]